MWEPMLENAAVAHLWFYNDIHTLHLQIPVSYTHLTLPTIYSV